MFTTIFCCYLRMAGLGHGRACEDPKENDPDVVLREGVRHLNSFPVHLVTLFSRVSCPPAACFSHEGNIRFPELTEGLGSREGSAHVLDCKQLGAFLGWGLSVDPAW